MPIILCVFNMFDANQKLIIKTSERDIEQIVQTNNFGNDVANICSMLNISNIHLFGVTEYVENYADNIKTAANIKYNLTNLNIELN